MRTPPAIGEVFRVPHPFVRGTFTQYDEDEDGFSSSEIQTWRPGLRVENRHSPIWTGEDVPDPTNVADAIGAQILTVVGVYRPGRFPTRVFYERQWVDPDGKMFGKRKCRMTTVPAFYRIVAGFRVPYELVDPADVLVGREVTP